MTDFVTWFIQQIWSLCCVPKDHSACWLKLHHNGTSQYSRDLFTPVRICWMLWNGLSGFDCWFLAYCVDRRVGCFTADSHLTCKNYVCIIHFVFFFYMPSVQSARSVESFGLWFFLVSGFCPFVLGSVTQTNFQGHCGIKIHQLNFTFLSRFFSDCVQIVYGC